MKKALISSIIVLIGFVLIFPVCSNAQGREGHGGGFGKGNWRGHGQGWILGKLDLSPEQQEKLACEKPGQGKEIKEKLRNERELLNSMIRDKTIPDEEIKLQMNKVNQTLGELNNFRLQRMLKVRSILTEEQLQKLRTLSKEPALAESDVD
ncbi:MAG: hypothetical protein GYA55_03270 [SAR324 cluster bacterium]|uniref:Periplasmic heavy metal sensor n=1 Tax=SAR324 cluster bacterium TaxID=2024889 RepID=A0A7X9FQ75_9DELT|nr:hypothetical protein [SAR324 cluster bacterium]